MCKFFLYDWQSSVFFFFFLLLAIFCLVCSFCFFSIILPPKNFPSLQVPKGHVWIEGDNIYNSYDSRNFGAVPYGLIQSKVFWRVRCSSLTSSPLKLKDLFELHVIIQSLCVVSKLKVRTSRKFHRSTRQKKNR